MAGTQLRKSHIAKWRGEIPIESLYTAGIGGQRFFKALKEKGEQPEKIPLKETLAGC